MATPTTSAWNKPLALASNLFMLEVSVNVVPDRRLPRAPIYSTGALSAANASPPVPVAHFAVSRRDNSRAERPADSSMARAAAVRIFLGLNDTTGSPPCAALLY
jgi:hypothetical protein